MPDVTASFGMLFDCDLCFLGILHIIDVMSEVHIVFSPNFHRLSVWLMYACMLTCHQMWLQVMESSMIWLQILIIIASCLKCYNNQTSTNCVLEMSHFILFFLDISGAVFNQIMGYERPAYFDKSAYKDENGVPKFRIAETKTFGKPHWFDIVAAEYEACREKIGLLDYSTFTKIDLWSKGKEVVDLLQMLCSNDMDAPVGSIIHTGMHNRHGMYHG